ncbi:Metallo-dependent phosphatase [Rhizopogon vinicolor AM-OR11-026]|uniref:Metallo-dependent phosphatase n=1 Tax=Rhizopogon vinicolor AM-OR11-026 TaxID=1314800 RepID=A0A1B7MP00_9AGAM|nr:Metallo-dependent phosphatase [Rhizopogon vinicolor AM-OR11-026]
MARRSDCLLFVFFILLALCFFASKGADSGDLRTRFSVWTGSCCKFPDFSHYDHFTHTLSDKEFPTKDKNRRIVVIGDLHGMNSSLTALLNQISYDVRKDTLIHLGDLVTKATVDDSLAVLSFMATNKVLGVRGNNDQDVIQWRSWMDWILSQPGGRTWLEKVDKHWSDYEAAVEMGDVTAFDPWPSWLKKSDWGRKVPKGWKPLAQHYQVARAMSREHYEYLRSLPLILHAPAGHVFFVHAGLLAADPTRRPTHPKQPLSHWPSMINYKDDIPALREAQEFALLSEVPQNRDPLAVQNMRSVLSNGEVSRSNSKGTPFSDLWNEIMGRCSGFHSETELASVPRLTGNQENLAQLPCYPSTVVYGHAAVRGLDVKRWSIGLDSGCSYGRRLSALVLDAGSFHSEPYHAVDFPLEATHGSDPGSSSGALEQQIFDFPPEATDRFSPRIKFGHAGDARIVSVKCH